MVPRRGASAVRLSASAARNPMAAMSYSTAFLVPAIAMATARLA
jgi:hypothetical protein